MSANGLGLALAALGAALAGSILAGTLLAGCHPALTWSFGTLGLLAGLPLLRRRRSWAALGLGPAPGWAWGRASLLLALALPASICFSLALESLIPATRPADLQALEEQFARVAALGWLPTLLVLAILPGLAEEALFRGPVQVGAQRAWGPLGAIALSTLLFTIVHLSLWRMPAQACLGLALGLLAWRCGSVWPGVLVHAGHNAGLLLLSGVIEGLDHRRTLLPLTLALLAAGAAILLAARPAPRHLGSPPSR